MALPDSLAHKIELFESHGRIVRYNQELFNEISWLQVMYGQGLRPRAHHPLADQLTGQELALLIDSASRQSRKEADLLPPHADFVRSMGMAG
jgi:tryptophan halogenase